jgi:pilus assembly protein CpaC
VEFTPWVNADGTIHLKLAPEVSTLDYSNAVTISGFTIPALSTRRAETEVELRDGESFAVSGLLDHRTTEILSKVPGIGDLPVLGDLFRSKNVNHSVVELVVIVTATIVDPLGTLPVTENTKPTFVVPNLDPNAFDASFFGGAHSKPQTVPQARTPGEKP